MSRDTRIISVPTALSERVAYSWRCKRKRRRRREKEEGEGGGGRRRRRRGKEEEEEGEEGITHTHQEQSTVTIMCTTQLGKPDVNHYNSMYNGLLTGRIHTHPQGCTHVYMLLEALIPLSHTYCQPKTLPNSIYYTVHHVRYILHHPNLHPCH